MDAPGVEIIDHTADVAIRVRTASLEELFRQAAAGMYTVIGNVRTASDARRINIALDADGAEQLLHDWLAELLFRFDARHEVISDVTFDRLDDRCLRVHGAVSSLDVARSDLSREIKAVTYHGLTITRSPGAFEVTVLFDI